MTARVVPPLAYRVEEAAEALRVGRDAIYALINSGELPAFKVGGSRRISVKALAEYVDRQTAAAREAS